jgi:hypothetical protein
MVAAFSPISLCKITPVISMLVTGGMSRAMWDESLFCSLPEALTRITQRSVYALRRLIGIRYSSVAGKRPTNPLRTFVCINEV